MQLGLLLPLARPYAADESSRIGEAIQVGFSSLWLEEWPVGVGEEVRRDHGTGHDPLVYSAYLGQQFRGQIDHVGFAALRLDYRPPQVTARAIVSAQWLGGSPLAVGLGCRTTTPEAVQSAAADWLRIRACLEGRGESGTFLLPSGFVAPPMLLTTRSPDLWEAIEYQADGFMTYQIDPRKTAPTVELVRGRRPQATIALVLFARVAIGEPDVLYLDDRAVFVIGQRRLAELGRLWADNGFTQIIYRPAETPSREQLELLAACVRG